MKWTVYQANDGVNLVFEDWLHSKDVVIVFTEDGGAHEYEADGIRTPIENLHDFLSEKIQAHKEDVRRWNDRNNNA